MILYDRGMLDTKAYVPNSLWTQILNEIGESEEDLLNRYHLIIHMTTAANGAVHAYGTADNVARTETLTEAIDKCQTLEKVYVKHQNVMKIMNASDGFQGKLERAAREVLILVSQIEDHLVFALLIPLR